MNILKAAVIPALVLVLTLPIVSEAVVFNNISGAVKSMNVQLTTVSFGGRLLKTTVVNTGGKDIGSIVSDEAANFWEFSDTVVFSNAQLDMVGSLISPSPGTSAFGPTEFLYQSPAIQPRDGSQTTAYGSVNVEVATNVGKGKATVKATNFTPSFVQVENFRNNTSVSVAVGRARISIPSMQKKISP